MTPQDSEADNGTGPQPALASLASEAFCYLATTGWISGRPHTIEIWFALDGSTCTCSRVETAARTGSAT